MNYSRQQPPAYRDPDFSADFSELNWRLRPNPRMSATEQLYCSLSRLPSKSNRRGPDKPLRRTASFSETEDDGPSVRDSADHSRVPDSAGHSRVTDASGSDGAPDQERSDSPTLEGGDNPFQRSYGTLPDLINSGRPLSRRRTVGHVNDTLKEVRREVELSRRRSMKLKAQVDKLQESRHGPKWSQDQERVTEEVLSILRLMQLMAEDSGSRLPEPLPSSENRLDAALAQLQDIARKMAVSGIAKKDAKSTGGSSSPDSALLQQALRDRDDAIEKKKAMEEELLRSKSEMMLLNNQLLEAAQKRLELSLELEAWKDDVQLLLHQQLLLQQQVDQNQKKPSRMGILRRNKPPVQRPANFPVAPAPASPASPSSPTQNPTQNFFSRPQLSPTSPSQATSGWRKWNKTNGGRPSVEAPQRKEDDGFQVVSLD